MNTTRWKLFIFRFSFFCISNLFVFRFSIFEFELISHFDIQNPIFILKLGPIITFWFEILFWYSNCDWTSNFDIRNPFLTFEMMANIEFWHSNWGRKSIFDILDSILIFELGPNIAFWCSKSYFDIRIGARISNCLGPLKYDKFRSCSGNVQL